MSINNGTEASDARHEDTVKPLYKDETVAKDYIENRFTWSWSRLLHLTQVKALNYAIEQNNLSNALELAPGPARLTTEVQGIRSGLMIEASEEMIDVARNRLMERNIGSTWEIRQGNAFDLSEIPDKFDLVYTFRFIRHFEKEERGRLYEQVSSHLAENGIFVFDVVNKTVRDKIDKIASANENLENLAVYDATYLENEVQLEIGEYGLKVLCLVPVIKHYFLQSAISYKLDSRLPFISKMAIQLLDKIPTKAPLEWVAVCRKEN